MNQDDSQSAAQKSLDCKFDSYNRISGNWLGLVWSENSKNVLSSIAQESQKSVKLAK